MRFIDEAIITVAGGHGGPGCISFRRETFVPRGGPDGGDGGAGGDIVLVSTSQLSTLQDFRFKREYQAPSGNHGSGSNKAGRDGEDIEIKVPVGTIIRDAETEEVLIDFTEEGQKHVICTGGRGGKGNAHFVSSTFQAPKFAQPGEAGEFKKIKLELKLFADVAIIGFPNAGKSTLISSISAAHPKIADYAFTTLVPNLGVVQIGDSKTLVVADVPGLIEGAHKGLGLGTRFLKHMERTSCFIHLMDGAKLLEEVTAPGLDDRGFDLAIERFVKNYEIIRTELKLYDETLLQKPELVVLNKIELFESEPVILKKVSRALNEKINENRRKNFSLASYDQGAQDYEEPLLISAVSKKGIPALLKVVSALIEKPKLEAQKTLLPDDQRIRQTRR